MSDTPENGRKELREEIEVGLRMMFTEARGKPGKDCICHVAKDIGCVRYANGDGCVCSCHKPEEKPDCIECSHIGAAACSEHAGDFTQLDRIEDKIGRLCSLLAYDEKARELFGPFARLNFPIVQA